MAIQFLLKNSDKYAYAGMFYFKQNYLYSLHTYRSQARN